MASVTRNDATAAWTLVVPVKPLSRAKSRLAGAAVGDLRPSLALAFAQDTVTAATRCRRVREVWVVTDDPTARSKLSALGARVVPDVPAQRVGDPTTDGLNAALRHGVGEARAAEPGASVAALNADLPALRAAELARALEVAAGCPRAFVADAAGVGTTLLTAVAGTELAPAFGVTSRVRHRLGGAREITLESIGGLRRDVDTIDDLRYAVARGVGPHTTACLGRLTAGGRRRLLRPGP